MLCSSHCNGDWQKHWTQTNISSCLKLKQVMFYLLNRWFVNALVSAYNKSYVR